MLEDSTKRQPFQTQNAEANLASENLAIARLGLWRFAVIIIASTMLLNSTGCTSTRDAVWVSYRDAVWAKRAYNLRYGNCERPYGDHFETGFCTGYADTCNGGDGYVPAMPPSDYRGFEYQSSEGVKCVDAWFKGYPAGVAAAKKEKIGSYNNVLTSKMIDSAISQEKATKFLPDDIPVVGSSNQDNQNRDRQTGSNRQNDSTRNDRANSNGETTAQTQAQPPFETTLPVNYRRKPYSAPPVPSIIGSGIKFEYPETGQSDDDSLIPMFSPDSVPPVKSTSTPRKPQLLTPFDSTP